MESNLMIHNDQVLGKPLQQYNDLKANIEALAGVPEGSERRYCTASGQDRCSRSRNQEAR